MMHTNFEELKPMIREYRNVERISEEAIKEFDYIYQFKDGQIINKGNYEKK